MPDTGGHGAVFDHEPNTHNIDERSMHDEWIIVFDILNDERDDDGGSSEKRMKQIKQMTSITIIFVFPHLQKLGCNDQWDQNESKPMR